MFSKRNSLSRFHMLLAIIVLLVGVPTLSSQAVSIASVSGRVTDTSGAVLPGAQITMTAVDTNVTRAAVADANGNYDFPSLPIGPYTMRIAAPGFQTYVQTGIRLQVNDAPEINVAMKVGQVTQNVQVEADATMV